MESFAHQTKQKLFAKKLGANCCRYAFFLGLCASLLQKKEKSHRILLPLTEMEETITKFIRNYLKKDYQIETDPKTKRTAVLFDGSQTEKLLCEALDAESFSALLPHVCPECKKKFLRGAFIGGGRVLSPEKGYSLELDCKEFSPFVASVSESVGLEFKRAKRRGREYLYMKKSSSIEDFFVYIGEQELSIAIMNEKIEKQYRNDANRVASCESNNIAKSVQAAGEQIDTIERLIALDKFSLLPQELQEAAKMRLENREASLTALGRLLSPPLTKSGVNHRLQKIMEFAKQNL